MVYLVGWIPRANLTHGAEAAMKSVGRLPSICCLLLGGVSLPPGTAAQAGRHKLVAVFAHPDDERIVGPLLARYAREGHDMYLVIATDGRKGVREHAGIPAGDSLAHVRAGEARCAARELGIHPPTLLGFEDAGLASFESLEGLRTVCAAGCAICVRMR
jgi:hypothetical protein